jgi:hypothetical protein
VTSTGEEEKEEPDEEFWKANAQLYMVEDIPLGVVRMEVPRNAGDAEAYALRKAKAWFGLERPERVHVSDFAEGKDEFSEISGAVHVEMDFHGSYER